ncbi:Glycerol-3-phosphate regulon repressor [subsurface metagenome]
MLQERRQNEIIQILQRKEEIRVSEITKLFGVSQNTIRRDLKELERMGLVKKVYGGAVINEKFPTPDLPYRIRESSMIEEKREIGLIASKLIQNGENIILDLGTTTLEIAKNLHKKAHLTIITNNFSIVEELRGNPHIHVIVAGGEYRETAKGCVGYYTEEFFSKVHQVDRTFLSCGGITPERGIMNPTHHELKTKREMIRAGREVYVVATSEKIGKTSFASFCSLSEIDAIITDKHIPEVKIQTFQKLGIRIIREQKDESKIGPEGSENRYSKKTDPIN